VEIVEAMKDDANGA